MQLARACHTGGREASRHCKEPLSIPPHVLWYISPKTLDISILSRFASGVLGCCLACLAKNGYQLQPLLRHVQTGLAATFLAQKATSREIDRVQSCRECSPREILPCFVQPPHRCAILDVPLLARLCLCAVQFLTGQFFLHFRNSVSLHFSWYFARQLDSVHSLSTPRLGIFPSMGHGIDC
jgi:hypothetical protein